MAAIRQLHRAVARGLDVTGAVPAGGHAQQPGVQDAWRGYNAPRRGTRAILAALTLLFVAAPVAGVAAPLPALSGQAHRGHGAWPDQHQPTPDTNATLLSMPLDTDHWKTMVINGKYPEVRFFNFSTYAAIGLFVNLERSTATSSPTPGQRHQYVLQPDGQ